MPKLFFLKSYKISVRAEDLQRALDPSVWPLRVKVREFIHYSRKTIANHKSVGGSTAQHLAGNGQGQQGLHSQHAHGQTHQAGGGSGQGGELRGTTPFLAPNRFALPEDSVPGGPGQAV